MMGGSGERGDDPGDDPGHGSRAAAAGGRPVGVVLAAGAAMRFGGPKQVVLVGGEPLVVHVLEVLAAVVDEVVVVVGEPWAAWVRAAVVAWIEEGGDAESEGGPRSGRPVTTLVANPDPSGSMGSSLAVAAAAVGARPLVVALADQPGLVVAEAAAVVAALDRGAQAVRVRHPDGPGHPVGFATGLHDRLVGLGGARLGRDLLTEVVVTHVDVQRPRPVDVDTPADLAAAALARANGRTAPDQTAVPGAQDPRGTRDDERRDARGDTSVTP